MSLTKTPICDFGKKAEDFKLKSINNELVSLENIKGTNGTLIMFICNHCPYVKAIIKDLVEDCKNLRNDGINSVAIMSNDTKNYPDDSFDPSYQVSIDPLIFSSGKFVLCVNDVKTSTKKDRFFASIVENYEY